MHHLSKSKQEPPHHYPSRPKPGPINAFFDRVKKEQRGTYLHVAHLVDEGDFAYMEHDFETALIKYDEILELVPRNPICLATRASIHLKMENYQLAEKDALKAVQIHPNLDIAQLRKAQVHIAFGDPVQAYPALLHFIALNPRGNSNPEYYESVRLCKILQQTLRRLERDEPRDHLRTLQLVDKGLKVSPASEYFKELYTKLMNDPTNCKSDPEAKKDKLKNRKKHEKCD